MNKLQAIGESEPLRVSVNAQPMYRSSSGVGGGGGFELNPEHQTEGGAPQHDGGGDDADSENDDGNASVLESIVESIQETYEHAVETAETVVEDVVERAEQVVEDVREGVLEECHEIKELLVEKLRQADDGDLYFMDMGLTRQMSLLPMDIVNVAQRIDEHLEDDDNTLVMGDEEGFEHTPLKSEEEDQPTKTKIPILAYLGLILAVISLSSIGPLLNLQSNCSHTMKISWRMTGTAIMLLPVSLWELRKNGRPRLTMAQWTTFMISTVCYTTMCVGFVLALKFTAVGNAVILSNSQAVLLLLGNLCVGSPVTRLEGLGAIAAFCGAILCSKDSSDGAAEETTMGRFGPLIGDSLALLAGLGGCGYLIFARTVRANMGLFTFTFLTMATGAGMCLLLQVIVLRENVTLDLDPETGIGGFLLRQPDRLPLEIVMVLVCNVCGTMGYVNAMRYFDSIIIAVAGLLEPVMAELISFVLDLSVLPGPQGWLGNLMVMAGTLAVVYPSDGKAHPSSSGH